MRLNILCLNLNGLELKSKNTPKKSLLIQTTLYPSLWLEDGMEALGFLCSTTVPKQHELRDDFYQIREMFIFVVTVNFLIRKEG